MILSFVLGSVLLLQASPIPCNRFVKVIATGSIAERKTMAAALTAPAEEIVKACPEGLRHGFSDPLRAHLPTPSMETWRVENQWLAAYLRGTTPKDASGWGAKLDVTVIPPATVLDLLIHWGKGTTAASEAIFDILDRIQSPAFRNEALHDLEPLLLDLEATDVTTATRLQSRLDDLGFGYLPHDSTGSVLWSLRLAGSSAEVTQAELYLAQGAHAKAFGSYAQASKSDSRYTVHTALLANSLLQEKALDVSLLIPLQIDYRKCEDLYVVNWKFGALFQVGERIKDDNLAALLAEKAGEKCDDETSDRMALLKASAGRYPQTKTGKRALLSFLTYQAAEADALTKQGRGIQANELRQQIWTDLGKPESFRFLGGISRARNLKARVGQFLAFPPEPEVHFNEREHLKRNERGEIVEDEDSHDRQDQEPPFEEDAPWDYQSAE